MKNLCFANDYFCLRNNQFLAIFQANKFQGRNLFPEIVIRHRSTNSVTSKRSFSVIRRGWPVLRHTAGAVSLGSDFRNSWQP